MVSYVDMDGTCCVLIFRSAFRRLESDRLTILHRPSEHHPLRKRTAKFHSIRLLLNRRRIRLFVVCLM